MNKAIILGSGSYVPERIVPNSFFNEVLGENVDTWLRENLTIEERRWCAPNESTADLAENAARKALANANISADQLDLLIIATDTPEYISPSTASVVQHRIGAKYAGTFDLNSACAGFVTALTTASNFIRADERYQQVLVLGVYAMSKYLDLTDKKTVTLFADGAAGFVLKSSTQSEGGFLTGTLYTEGEYSDWMGIYAGGTHQTLSHETIERKDHLLKFVKKFPKEINSQTWTKMIQESCEKINILPQQIDHFFFTQININTIWETVSMLGAEKSKAHTIMSKFGYTGSACIPMAFDDAYAKGKIKKGDILCFMGSGGGLAFANALFKF